MSDNLPAVPWAELMDDAEAAYWDAENVHGTDAGIRALTEWAYRKGIASLSAAPAPLDVPVVLPEGYEWCTTEGRTRRHISRALAAPHGNGRRSVKGRTGRTLCGQSGRDEEYAQWQLDQWRASGKKLVVANLPLCRLCPKSLPEVAR